MGHSEPMAGKEKNQAAVTLLQDPRAGPPGPVQVQPKLAGPPSSALGHPFMQPAPQGRLGRSQAVRARRSLKTLSFWFLHPTDKVIKAQKGNAAGLRAHSQSGAVLGPKMSSSGSCLWVPAHHCALPAPLTSLPWGRTPHQTKAPVAASLSQRP